MSFKVVILFSFFLLAIIVFYIYIKYNFIGIQRAKSYNICFNQSKNVKYYDNSISLLTWNIHKEAKKKNFRDEIVKIITTNNINLLLLQEFNINNNLSQTIDITNINDCIFAPNTKITIKNEISGLLNASITKSMIHKAVFTVHREPISNTPKIALLTTYKIKNKNYSLLTINIHGINFKLDNKIFKKELNILIKKIKNHRGPIIFGGDFNTWNKDRLIYLKNSIKQIGLTEVSFKGDIAKSILGYPLDHIFYTQKYLKLKYSFTISNLKISDHKPLLAGFEFIY